MTIAFILIFIPTLIFMFLPLGSQLSAFTFESAMTMNGVVVAMAPFILMLWREPTSFANKAGRLFLVLLGPSVLLLINQLRGVGCDFVYGVLFWLMLPMIGVLLTVSVVHFCEKRLSKPLHRFLAYYAIVITSLLITALRVLTGPQVYAFDVFWGYVPGPIYDPEIAINLRFVLHRLLAVVAGAWWLAAAFVSKDNRKAHFGLAITSIMVLGSFLFEGKLGFYHSRSFIQKELGGVVQSDHVHVYFDKNLEKTGFNPKSFLNDCEFWRHTIVDKLKLKGDRKVAVYVYGDADRKKYLMGAGRTFIGDPINGEIHMLRLEFPNSILQHELVHLLSREFGLLGTGFARTPAFLEGLAVAVEEYRLGESNDTWAKVFIEEGSSGNLERVISSGLFFKLAGIKSYSLAGSFVGYLMNTYGVDAVKSVYRSGNFEKGMGEKLVVLLANWQNHLKQIDLSEQSRAKILPYLEQKGVFEQRCPHASATWRNRGQNYGDTGSLEEAISCFSRSYQLSGGAELDLYFILTTLVKRKTERDQLASLTLALKLRKSNRFRDVADDVLIKTYLNHDAPLLALRRLEKSDRKLDRHQTILYHLLRLGYWNEAKEWIQLKDNEDRMRFAKALIDAKGGFPELNLMYNLNRIEFNAGNAKQLKQLESNVLQLSDDVFDDNWNNFKYRTLGRAYLYANNFEKAALYFSGLKNQGERKRWLERLLWQKRKKATANLNVS